MSAWPGVQARALLLQLHTAHPLGAGDLHDFGGGAALGEEGGHGAHGGVDVGVEFFVAGAEIVHTGFAVRSVEKAVLRTFAVAGELGTTPTLVFGEGGSVESRKGLNFL